MSSNKEIVAWGSDGDERLNCTEIDEAIEEALERSEETEGTLEICGFARMGKPTPECLSSYIMERVLEDLDCNYGLGDPEEGTDPTKKMEEASLVFAKAILEDYKPWSCEIVERKNIDIAKWLKESD